jgi:hypothetical protein
MSIQNALNAAVYTTLTGGTALTNLLSSETSVYFLQAPDDCTDTEYVVFSYQGGGDENQIPNRMKNNVLNVRAISGGGTASGPALAGSIDAQIDALLHLKPLTVAGWENFWTAREMDIVLMENDEAGIKFFTSGGLYRIRLDKE